VWGLLFGRSGLVFGLAFVECGGWCSDGLGPIVVGLRLVSPKNLSSSS
jgi:hypothetical protein